MSVFSSFLPSFQIQLSWWIFKVSLLPGQVLIVYRFCWHLCRSRRVMMCRGSGSVSHFKSHLHRSLRSPATVNLKFTEISSSSIHRLSTTHVNCLFLDYTVQTRGHLCARRVVRDHFFTSKQFLQQIAHSMERQFSCRLLFAFLQP